MEVQNCSSNPTLSENNSDLNTCTYTPATTEQRYWQVQVEHTTIESVAVSITPSSHQQFTIFVIELVGSKALYKPCATFKVQSAEAEESEHSMMSCRETSTSLWPCSSATEERDTPGSSSTSGTTGRCPPAWSTSASARFRYSGWKVSCPLASGLLSIYQMLPGLTVQSEVQGPLEFIEVSLLQTESRFISSTTTCFY